MGAGGVCLRRRSKPMTLNQAVKALLREVAVLKSSLRREDQWQALSNVV
jgi:hypothetical protein